MCTLHTSHGAAVDRLSTRRSCVRLPSARLGTASSHVGNLPNSTLPGATPGHVRAMRAASLCVMSYWLRWSKERSAAAGLSKPLALPSRGPAQRSQKRSLHSVVDDKFVVIVSPAQPIGAELLSGS